MTSSKTFLFIKCVNQDIKLLPVVYFCLFEFLKRVVLKYTCLNKK
jgi:hypothetical protein